MLKRKSRPKKKYSAKYEDGSEIIIEGVSSLVSDIGLSKFIIDKISKGERRKDKNGKMIVGVKEIESK